jgi:hypothetical protein
VKKSVTVDGPMTIRQLKDILEMFDDDHYVLWPLRSAAGRSHDADTVDTVELVEMYPRATFQADGGLDGRHLILEPGEATGPYARHPIAHGIVIT